MKNVVVLGGGNGMSAILQGLKKYPVNISAIVSVSDDGKSTGRLREEFNIPAVGDLRRIIAALSETEPEFCELFNYRFKTTSDLNDHVVGNLISTAIFNMFDDIQDGIAMLERVMKVKGKVLPLTEDNVDLVGITKDGTEIVGEVQITESKSKIVKLKYNKPVTVYSRVLEEIKKAGLEPYYTEHGIDLFPENANGVPFTTAYISATGDVIANIVEDMAAEQKARAVYENLISLATDQEVIQPLLFLRQREIVHYQRFSELLDHYKKLGF